MDRYASVSFRADEKEKQRLFLLAMNGAEIIQVSRDDIERWYKEDTEMNSGCNNRIVLHSDEEVNRFKYVMKTFFEGVKYKIEQPNGKGWIGLEYQIQDDAHVEDGKIEDRKIASLFDVLPASPSSKADAYPAPAEVAPSGEFRSGTIVVAGNHIEHWIDGEKVLSFNVGSDKWNAAKADSKFKNQKNFGLVVSSPILLQCHGYPVEFRNLKLQKLTGK